MKALVVLEDWHWLLNHAEQDSEGRWICKETGQRVVGQEVPRLIWLRDDSSDNPLERPKQVLHLVCPRCNPNRRLPSAGEPIYDDQIREIDLTGDAAKAAAE